MSFTEIKYAVTDRVAVVTLNRPDQLNAWTAVMGKEVRQAMEQAIAGRKPIPAPPAAAQPQGFLGANRQAPAPRQRTEFGRRGVK